MRRALAALRIDANIPDTCGGLQGFSRQYIKQKMGNGYVGDGPEVVVELRNDLVHNEKKYPNPSGDVQLEAMRLSRGYIEVMLLKKLGFSGQYFDRLQKTNSTLQ